MTSPLPAHGDVDRPRRWHRQVSVAEMWDVRRVIEMRTADLAADRRSAAEAAAIVTAAEAIAQANGNALYLQIVRSFKPLIRVAVPAAWTTRTTDAGRERVMTHQLALVRAIERSAPDNARAAMDQHFDLSIESGLMQIRRA